MFTLTWLPSEPRRNLVFEPTLSLERAFGRSIDVFVEYVGDYGQQRQSQILDTGGAVHLAKPNRSISTSAMG